MAKAEQNSSSHGFATTRKGHRRPSQGMGKVIGVVTVVADATTDTETDMRRRSRTPNGWTPEMSKDESKHTPKKTFRNGKSK